MGVIMAISLLRDIEDSWTISAKRNVRSILLSDSDILELLKDDISEEDAAKLSSVDNPFTAYERVFPYIYVPTAQTREGCYVCFKIDEEIDDWNNPYGFTRYIMFVVFCSPAYMDTGLGANRVDILAHCIQDIFEFSNPLGLEWYLQESIESVLTSNYIERSLLFRSNTIKVKTRSRDGKAKSIDGLVNPYVNTNINPAMIRNNQGVELYSDINL